MKKKLKAKKRIKKTLSLYDIVPLLRGDRLIFISTTAGSIPVELKMDAPPEDMEVALDQIKNEWGAYEEVTG